MLVHGIDDNDNVIPLLLDASGNVIVSASQITTTGGKIKVDSSGRLIVDFETDTYLRPSSVLSQGINGALAAGVNTVIAYTVPAGMAVVIDTISFVYVGTVAGVTIQAYIFTAGNLVIYDAANLVNGRYTYFSPNVLLDNQYSIRFQINGATAGDVFVGNVVGRRIR